MSWGRRWKSAKGIRRFPIRPCTWTTAASAASATHMSDGCVATQEFLPKEGQARGVQIDLQPDMLSLHLGTTGNGR
ncbi:hypothetical protein GCM10011247_16320 [Pseudomonas plecoglossicida]|nr:hypothetical protein GCM10011247_16320 [Pseudomonas plecoglossicida]